MPAHVESMLVAASVLVIDAAALTGFALRRQHPRGFVAFIAALWMAAAGCFVSALAPQAVLRALADVLMLMWPLGLLAGARRFHSRQQMLGSLTQDGVVFGAAVGAMFAARLLPGAPLAALPLICATIAHGYAVLLLSTTGPRGLEGNALRALAFAVALGLLVPWLGGWWDASASEMAAARNAGAALAGTSMSFILLIMASERTERQLRESRRRLHTLAHVDALTQMPNRRRFGELAQAALASDEPGSDVLVMLDIDHFKRINDSLGHAGGDRALILVAASVLEQLRAQDVAARFGGDEFVLLLRRTHTRAALAIGERIVHAVQARVALEQLPRLTLSMGMVQVRPGESLDEATRRADQALYEAKRQGRARAVTAEGNEDEPVFSESQPLGLMAS